MVGPDEIESGPVQSEGQDKIIAMDKTGKVFKLVRGEAENIQWVPVSDKELAASSHNLPVGYFKEILRWIAQIQLSGDHTEVEMKRAGGDWKQVPLPPEVKKAATKQKIAAAYTDGAGNLYLQFESSNPSKKEKKWAIVPEATKKGTLKSLMDVPIPDTTRSFVPFPNGSGARLLGPMFEDTFQELQVDASGAKKSIEYTARGAQSMHLVGNDLLVHFSTGPEIVLNFDGKKSGIYQPTSPKRGNFKVGNLSATNGKQILEQSREIKGETTNPLKPYSPKELQGHLERSTPNIALGPASHLILMRRT